MRHRSQRENLIAPRRLTADGLLLQTIHVVPKVIVPGLGRDLPPEGEGRGTVHRPFHERTPAISDGPGLGRVDTVMSRDALGEPGEISPRGHVTGDIKPLGQGKADGQGEDDTPGHAATHGNDRQGIAPQNDVGSRRQGQGGAAGAGWSDTTGGERSGYPRGEPANR